jgi:hypothetical protein
MVAIDSEPTIVSVARIDDSQPKPSFLAVAIDSQITIALCGRNRHLYDLRSKITFLSHSCNLQLSSVAEIAFCTIYG